VNPDQAIDILDRAASMAPLPRADHIAVAQAVQVLREALAPKPPPDDKDHTHA
jgi:hypothetical protein